MWWWTGDAACSELVAGWVRLKQMGRDLSALSIGSWKGVPVPDHQLSGSEVNSAYYVTSRRSGSKMS